MATTRFFVGVLALVGACAPAHAARNYRVGAFYYGPWHVDPANEKLHGKNWTEWNLVKVISQKPSIVRIRMLMLQCSECATACSIA